MTTGAQAALLIFADGRLPAGGYAHSGGLEPAVVRGDVRTVADLESFLTGRLRTVGLVAAAFAAAACRRTAAAAAGRPDDLGNLDDLDDLDDLDAELDARTPSPAQRATSRQLGRQLARTVCTIIPQVKLHHLGRTPHQPIVLGATFAQIGLGPSDAALASLHEAAAGPVAAAVRLLSTDPFATHRVLARLAPLVDELAAQAGQPPSSDDDLPMGGAPLLDINAERHVRFTGRLFAS